MTQENLSKRIEELEAQVHGLEKDLIHDALTSLKTRAFLEEELGIYLKAIAQNKEGKRKEWFGFKNVSVIFFDIDHFKSINDKYGHEIGDKVLSRIATEIQKHLRTGDTAARWGGEEMVVSLLGANESDAALKAEVIRRAIANISFPEAKDLKLTISSGVASSEKGIDIKEFVARADKALYAAKHGGRNRVVKYSEIS